MAIPLPWSGLGVAHCRERLWSEMSMGGVYVDGVFRRHSSIEKQEDLNPGTTFMWTAQTSEESFSNTLCPNKQGL